jgi:ABC-type phosphate transport system permease subunit
VSQQTVQAPAQTQVQAPEQTTVQTQVQAPAQATPSSVYTWPTAGAVLQRMPLSTATILVAICIALLAAAGMRRK